jgi:hypothetical protein
MTILIQSVVTVFCSVKHDTVLSVQLCPYLVLNSLFQSNTVYILNYEPRRLVSKMMG